MQQEVATPAARTNLAPIPMECDAPHLKVVGELPRELNGTLYRNGPNPQFEAPGAHWFVGDGMLHAFHLENGRASYRNRWVRTPKWQAEHDAGRALFGGITGPFTAHPKIDPVTGEMVFFGYDAAGPLTPALSFGSVNASGVVTRFDRLTAPYASMVHDFIVTEHHLLFPILPITGSMERAMRGQPAYAWEPDKGAYVGVMKRNGPAGDIVWFRAQNCYVFHVMNAWEDGTRIIADVMQFEEPPLFTHPNGLPTDPKKSRARLCRWIFDLAGKSDRFTQTYLDDVTGEFPRIDDRRAGRASGHGWYACANPDLTGVGALCGVVHVDGKGSRRGQYLLPAGDTISEAVFVPRGDEAAEGDGWPLASVWRAGENRSDLAVFNATDVEAGPVALVQLGHRVPDGFHGNWVGAA